MKKSTKLAPTKKVAVAKKAVTKKVVAKSALPKKAVAPKSASAAEHIITKNEGKAMINSFRNTDKSAINFTSGREFDKSIFEALLKLKGCKKIRIYNALDADGYHTLVLTAVDKAENDIYFKLKTPKSTGAKSAMAFPIDNSGVGNRGNQCPEYDTITSLI